jgi:hypothetical protein
VLKLFRNKNKTETFFKNQFKQILLNLLFQIREMEATEQDLLATQKALEEEVQNKVKEAVMDNFLRVSFD